MRKRPFSGRLAAFIFVGFFLGLSSLLSQPSVRPSVVAGSFYPADPKELAKAVDTYLAQAPAPAQKISQSDLWALVVPHAGYVYSGRTAAHAYKLLEGLQYDTVVLVGPCHRLAFEGASVWKSGAWQTPLGEVSVDERLAQDIFLDNEALSFDEAAHLGEHSLEVQLPFLQRTLKNFKIVPILISDPSPRSVRTLAKAIEKNISGKRALLIVSTDMSHYHADRVAVPMDRLTLDLLEKKDSTELFQKLRSGESELCGAAAVLTVLEIARLRGNAEIEVLDYSHSGRSSGDRQRVVGYGALLIRANPAREAVAEPAGVLNPDQQKELLGIARKTLESHLAAGQVPEFSVGDPTLMRNKGVFVTLRKNGALRGCIGSLTAQEPLYQAVQSNAVKSAVSDRRFQPVQAAELGDLTIEISVLSEPRKIRSVEEIELGKHGVILKSGFGSGVFLPKVALETGWSREEFLRELCTQKAGLSPDCWKDSATELYVFTSQDFGE